MALVVISIDRDKLPVHTTAQFDEWVRFNIEGSDINLKNPLLNSDMDAEVREI